ncbi:MAG: DUF6090 family protein [Halioglobus sp.]
MILRRITGHVKDQNWFAVGLDFFIVVVGILIAFQITSWNEGLIEQQRGKDYVERLTDDLRADLSNRRVLLVYYDSVYASAERTRDLLLDPKPDDRELVVSAYRATEYVYHPQTRRTWDEVVAAGDIGLLPTSVNTDLARYFSADVSFLSFDDLSVSAYRERVRRIISHNVQQAIRNGCSDLKDPGGMIRELNIQCNLDVTETDLSQATSALLSDPELLPDLRYQFSHLSIARNNMAANIDQLERILIVLEGNTLSTPQRSEQ